MPNPFYRSWEYRAAGVRMLFDRIATRYDLVNDVQSFGLHRFWKRHLVRLADVRPGERVLDLCCGTGDLALRLATPGVKVVGLDFSAPMLQVANRRARRAGAKSVGLCRADAMHIPFPDASFEVVTIGYGLRNLASLEGGLEEMDRVLVPGGRLLALDFGKPANAVWRGLYFTYLKLVVPGYGWLFCGSADAYAYILESLRLYPAQQGVAERMRALGWVNVAFLNLLGGVMSINYGEKA